MTDDTTPVPTPTCTLTPAADAPVFLTTAELCARWKVSVMFVWRLRQQGKLHACKLSRRRVRYALTDIERFEAESKGNA